MGEATHISWCDHTFNPWIGCTKVSVGDKGACEGCYAEAMMADRYGRVVWGKAGQAATYSRTGASYWKQPLAWNRKAAVAVEAWRSNPFARPETPKPTRFVFCASLADVFDNQVPVEWRRDLFDLIRATPHLTWLLLTKRPQNIVKLFAEGVMTGTYGARVDQIDTATIGRAWPRNAAIGCTVVTQAEADRDVPVLLRAKAMLKPALAFLSMEPLMEAVDISPYLGENPLYGGEQAERGIRLSGSGLRRLGDHAGRDDLAGAETRLGPLAEEGGQPALQAGSGGEAVGEERLLFPGHDHGGRKAGLRAGSPSGLSTLQGADPGGHDGQPRGREEEAQSSRQPGTGDALRTAEARREGLGRQPSSEPGISWIIVGGETDQGSHRARTVHPGWVRSLRDQCVATGTAFHFKQWGEWAPGDAVGIVQDGPIAHANGHVPDWMDRSVTFSDGSVGRVRGHRFTAHATNLVYRIGKRRAGRLLDGVTHDARPVVA